MATKHLRAHSAGISTPAVAGFLLPLLLAILIGLLVHGHQAQPTPARTQTAVSAETPSSTPTAPATAPPSAEEIAAANAAILAYCKNDLRQGTDCTLIDNSNVAAPGFVKSGVRMSGYFEGRNTSTDGAAVAKGSGNNWSVIWVGQGCVPTDIATKYAVPGSLGICGA